MSIKTGLLICIGILAGWLLSYSNPKLTGEQIAHAQAAVQVPQWEYRVEYIEDKPWPATVVINVAQPNKITEILTETYTKLGSEGWEYVGAHANASNAKFVVFKRLKR